MVTYLNIVAGKMFIPPTSEWAIETIWSSKVLIWSSSNDVIKGGNKKAWTLKGERGMLEKRAAIEYENEGLRATSFIHTVDSSNELNNNCFWAHCKVVLLFLLTLYYKALS